MSAKAKIDKNQVEKLAILGASNVEIGAFFGVTEEVIRRRFKSVAEQGRAKRKAQLRKCQWDIATDAEGDPRSRTTMLIFLGKCELGQRETAALELTGKNGGPIKTETKSKGKAFDYGKFEEIFNRMQIGRPGPQAGGDGPGAAP